MRTPACLPCDVLVVPRMHHFHTQTGLPDHIGSIPIMRIKTPRLRGLARAAKRCFDVLMAGVRADLRWRRCWPCARSPCGSRAARA